MEGMANGITDSLGMVEDAMDGLGDLVYSEAPTTDLATETTTSTSSFGDSGQYFSVPRQPEQRQINVILELDRMVLGRAVYVLNNEETQRVGVKLAGGYA